MAQVIVFGPTGAVGSAAAIFAQQHGAKVALAMRDTSKSIPGLSADAEKAGGFTRVQADLTKPDTVAAAVKTSGAKRAFFYLAMGSPDHMQSTIKAMKDAGIELVVFLSSYSIPINAPLRSVPKENLIPAEHAAVEAEMLDIFGPTGYVAVRGGAFASNIHQFKYGIAQGNVQVVGPDFLIDTVVPGDIGRVAGSVLASGPKNGQREVYVYGPKVRSQKDAIETVASILGKKISISPMSEEQGAEMFKQHMPAPFATYLAKTFASPDLGESIWGRNHYDEGVKNVLTYTGKPGMSFEDYVKTNTGEFTV